MQAFSSSAICLFLILGISPTGVLASEESKGTVVHIEPSVYRELMVVERMGTRCVEFSHFEGSHSCRYLGRDDYLYFDYVKAVFSAFAFLEDPQRVLIIGLGGGTIPSVMHTMYPGLAIDVAELDPAMLKVAAQFFDFSEDEQVRVHIGDGRQFVKRAALQNRQYDLVILDAFEEEYTPPHMTTREFLSEISRILTPQGVFVSHKYSGMSLYDHEAVTYQAVFGEFYHLNLNSGSKLIFSMNGNYPDRAKILQQSMPLIRKFQAFHISLDDYIGELSKEQDWDSTARILTDQYAPVNVLRSE
jgi:spermidine synthase